MLSSLNAYLQVLGWVFALVIILSVAFPILLHIINGLAGRVDLWKELRSKNLAVAVLLAGALIAGAIVIAAAL